MPAYNPLLLKDKCLSGISLIYCNEITSTKQNSDHECLLTIQMDDNHKEGMEILQNKLGICDNDSKIIDGKYCYSPPNSLIARRKPKLIDLDVRNQIINNFLQELIFCQKMYFF
jgi:hypothetical protein